MTTETLPERLRKLLERASAGPWEVDSVKNDGEYGDGPDTHAGFDSYAIFDAKGQTLFDSINSDATIVSEEYHEDGVDAWDEVAKRNFDLIVALHNEAPALLSRLEALESALAELVACEDADAFCNERGEAAWDAARRLVEWEVLESQEEMRADISIPERIAQLVSKHGGLRIAALALQIDAGYLSRLARGEKTDPSPEVLKQLGLKRIVTYKLRKP